MHLVLIALFALAPAGIDTDPELKKGQALIEAFEYEKAAGVLEALAQRPGLSEPDRAVVLVWLGLTWAELREQAKASVAFEDAVSADPLIVLPRDASPKIKALLEDARARVRLRPRTRPPENTTATLPPPIVKEVPPEPPPPPSSSLMPVAIITTVAGGVVAVAGGAVWGLGLSLRQQALDEPFQSEAVRLRDQSVASQLGGQITTGVGVAALVVGGVLIALSASE